MSQSPDSTPPPRTPIGPNTRVFMSFSATPGSFGATVYARLFARFGIDAVYIPRAAPGSSGDLVRAVRTLGLAGASVSSPHKGGVLEHLDELDDVARACGAVNTIVGTPEGVLRGTCTDGDGVEGALRGSAVSRACVFGSGGVVGPAVLALRRLGAERVYAVARNGEAARGIHERFGTEPCVGDEGAFDVVINATPAGDEDVPDALAALLLRTRALLDMRVTAKPRALWTRAEESGVRVVTGATMCVHQIVVQAGHYLARDVPIEAVRDAVRPMFGGMVDEG